MLKAMTNGVEHFSEKFNSRCIRHNKSTSKVTAYITTGLYAFVCTWHVYNKHFVGKSNVGIRG